MKKFLSIVLAAMMLLSCFGLSVVADEMLTTTAPVDGVWYPFEETIVFEVVPASGENYTFTSDSEPLYKGVDTTENVVDVGRFSTDMNNSKGEKIKTDENGKTYTEGDGNWNGRNSDRGYFVYQYRLAQGATKMQWTATIGGQYGVYVWVGGDTPEADESKWVQIAYFGGDGNGPAGSQQMLECDLTQFEGLAQATHLYVKMKDEEPSGGWGGRIALGLNYPVILSYNVDAPAVEYDPNASSDGLLHEIYRFSVATAEEKAYLYEDTANYNGGIHFADKSSSFTYLYNIENYTNMTSITWSAFVANQLYLQLSEDGTTWVDIYKWDGTPEENGSGGLSPEYMTFDLTKYVTGTSSTLYIKISDSYPELGWGGQIKDAMPVTLDIIYEELSEEEKAALEAAEQARKEAEEAAKREAEKAAAKEEAQATIDQINELAAYKLEDLTEDNYKDIFTKIRQARRAYNGLSELAIEVANESGVLAVLEAAEAMKAEYEAILEAKENEPTDDPAEPSDPTADPVDPEPEPEQPDDPNTPDEPEQPADEGGLNPIVIVVIAVVVIAAVVIVIIVSKKKK